MIMKTSGDLFGTKQRVLEMLGFEDNFGVKEVHGKRMRPTTPWTINSSMKHQRGLRDEADLKRWSYCDLKATRRVNILLGPQYLCLEDR